jgi:hypothetical protein
MAAPVIYQRLWINANLVTMNSLQPGGCGLLENHAIGVSKISLIASMDEVDLCASGTEAIDHPAQLAYELGPEHLLLRVYKGEPSHVSRN